jgi:negative regulator of flagellin synthesis FlgM
MSIEINGMTSAKVPVSSEETQLDRATEQTPTQQESGTSSTSDTVSLSENAVQLGKLETSVVSTPVSDTQRIERVKQAIMDGSYEIDPVKVAEKLMQFEAILKPGKHA